MAQLIFRFCTVFLASRANNACLKPAPRVLFVLVAKLRMPLLEKKLMAARFHKICRIVSSIRTDLIDR
jgi:hypothetical protein